MPWDLFGALGVAVIVGGRVARDMNCLLCNGGKHKPCYIISSKCMKEYLENNDSSKQNRIEGQRRREAQHAQSQREGHHDQQQSSRRRNNHDTSSSSRTDNQNTSTNIEHDNDHPTPVERTRLSPTSIIRNRLALSNHRDLVNNACNMSNNAVNYNAILHHAVIVDYNQQLLIWKDLVLGYHDLSPTGDAMYACQYIQSVLEWSQQQVPQALYVFVPEIIINSADESFDNINVDEKKDDNYYYNNNGCSCDDNEYNSNNSASCSNRGFLLTIQQRFRTEANGGEPLDHLHDLSYKLLFATTTKKQRQQRS